VLGVVAVGPDRGLSFQVCIEKKRCTVHWGDRIRESARHAKAVEKGEPSHDQYAEHERKRKELQEREKAEDARWMKAAPQLFAALAEKVKASPAGARGPLGLRILKIVGRRYGSAIKGADFPIGTSAEDLVRHVAFMLVVSDISDWRFAASATSALKEFGIKAAAIVDQVAPKPKAEPAPAKKRAGDVARAKKKAKG
jgi:hypothetical protein